MRCSFREEKMRWQCPTEWWITRSNCNLRTGKWVSQSLSQSHGHSASQWFGEYPLLVLSPSSIVYTSLACSDLFLTPLWSELFGHVGFSRADSQQSLTWLLLCLSEVITDLSNPLGFSLLQFLNWHTPVEGDYGDKLLTASCFKPNLKSRISLIFLVSTFPPNLSISTSHKWPVFDLMVRC